MNFQNKRQTAYKYRIGELLKGEYNKEEGEMGLVYVDLEGVKVSRVNIMANVVDHFDGDNYSYLELDDGSGSIRVKVWGDDIKLIKDVKVGDVVLFVGRIKEYNQSRYLVPEIIKSIDNLKWLEVRNKELETLRGKIERQVKEEIIVDKEPLKEPSVVEEQVVASTESHRQKVLSLIEKKEEYEIEDLIKDSSLTNEDVEKAVKELLKEGEIFEPRPGYLRVV
jgi:RPA family protein